MWTGPNSVATGLISQNAGANLVTIGNSGGLLVEGSTTLGDAITDTVTATGPVTLNKTLNIVEGIEVNGGAGTAGQVLTSGAGSGTVMSWTTPTTGVVESISGGAGITISGTSAIPVVSVDYLGTDNIILSAGTAVTPVGADTIMISDASDSGNVVKALISGLPFNNYSWTADSDEGTDITVTSGFNLKFTGAVTAGGAGIATDSAVSANEMTIGLINAGGTPGTTTFYRGDGQWSVPVGTKTETLAEVLVNGNTTGGTDIAVSAADDITFTNTSKAIFGTGSDLQIYHNGSNSYIKDSGTGDLVINSNLLAIQNAAATETMAKFIENGAVNLYYDDVKKFETTSAGVTILGQGLLMEGTSSPQEAVLTMGSLNNTPTIKMMKIGSNYIYSPNGSVVLRSGGTPVDALRIAGGEVFLSQYGQGNKLPSDPSSPPYNGYPTYDLAVSNIGKVLEVEQAFPYQKSGIFNGYSQITASTNAATLFTVTRESFGALLFDVWITTSSGALKRYVIAHQLNSTPVYNKLLEAPGGGSSTSGITITFDNATSSGGTTGNSVACKITTDANWNTTHVNWTVQVGYMFSGTLTVS
jgi:hypothetical protein